MMIRAIKILVFMLLLQGRVAAQQLAVQFFPEVDGRNLQGLLNARVLNPGGATFASLKISVSINDRVKVCEIRIPTFRVNNGLNVLPADAVRAAKYFFSNSSEGRLLAKSGIFSPNPLTYCYELEQLNFSGEEGGPNLPPTSSENCFDYDLVPLSPLSLSSPSDEERLCDQRPVFSWLPAYPLIPGSLFKLICVEIHEGQSSVEAMKYNLAFINQSSLQAPVFPWPANVRNLKAGKRYAWQVIQYRDDLIINRSEVWEFIAGCEEEVEEKKKKGEVIDTDKGYRDIEDLARGNNYITSGILKVAITNSYASQKLRYEVSCISEPSLKIKKLPEIQLSNGRNKILIDLSKDRGLKDNYTYILKLWLPDGSAKQLRFIYKSRDY